MCKLTDQLFPRLLFFTMCVCIPLSGFADVPKIPLERCGILERPDSYKVYAVGVKKAAKPLRWYKPGGSKKKGGIVTVNVTSKSQPVILVLTAYEPVLWKIGHVPGAEIAGVLVSGHYNQEVIGVAKGVPIKIITRETPQGCPYFHNHKPGAGVDPMNQRVYTLVGRGIDRFYSKVEASSPFYVGERGAVGAGYVQYENRHEWINIVDDSYDEEKYLKSIIDDGLVTVSPEKEITLWEKKAGRRANNPNPSFMSPDTTLYVQKKLVLPEERKRRYSFLVKKRVATPEGVKDDEYIYYLKDYTCRKGTGDRVQDDSCFKGDSST